MHRVLCWWKSIQPSAIGPGRTTSVSLPPADNRAITTDLLAETLFFALEQFQEKPDYTAALRRHVLEHVSDEEIGTVVAAANAVLAFVATVEFDAIAEN